MKTKPLVYDSHNKVVPEVDIEDRAIKNPEFLFMDEIIHELTPEGVKQVGIYGKTTLNCGNRDFKPGLCNRIRDEALSHNKPSSLASKAWHRYGGKANKAKRAI